MKNGTRCPVCRHPKVHEINKELLSIRAPIRAMAKKYGTDKTTLGEHATVCLQRCFKTLHEEKLQEQAVNVTKEFEANLTVAKDLQATAVKEFYAETDPRQRVALLRAALKTVEAVDLCTDRFARMAGLYQNDTPPPVNINFNRVILPPLPEGAEVFEMAQPPLLLPPAQIPHHNGNGNTAP